MKRTRSARPVLALTTALAVGAALAACSSGEEVSVAPTPTPTITPTPKPPPPPPNPLTGKPGAPKKRVLVVKMDNTAPSHPHVGLAAADVVYIEQVEGGLTRLAAVFSSKLPKTVGPVRSARMADIELFAQYGRVAFAYSGANPHVSGALSGANLALARDGYGGGWFRGYGRSAPYNLFTDPGNIVHARKHTAKARDIGFRFGPSVKQMKRSRGFDVTFRLARVSWRWSKAKKAWVWAMDGRPAGVAGGGQVAADNVIVQYTRIYASGLTDVTGSSSPFTETVGKGKAQFFRDGKVVSGHWSRAGKKKPTKWFVGKHRYRMKPGKTWIVLAPNTTRAHLV